MRLNYLIPCLLCCAPFGSAQSTESERMPQITIGPELPPFPTATGEADPAGALPTPPRMPAGGLPPPEAIDVYREAMPRGAEAARRAKLADNLVDQHRPDPVLTGPLVAILIALLIILSLGIAALASLAKKAR